MMRSGVARAGRGNMVAGIRGGTTARRPVAAYALPVLALIGQVALTGFALRLQRPPTRKEPLWSRILSLQSRRRPPGASFTRCGSAPGVQRWLRAAFGAYERLAYVVVSAASLAVLLW
jgi:hypothetical protein